MTRQPCTILTKAGQACKAAAIPGRAYCRWHSPDPADIANAIEASRRGGSSRGTPAGPSLEPIAETIDVAALDLETAAGVCALLAATLRQLARLPFSTTTANAIAQTVTAQRAVIDTSRVEGGLKELESLRGPRRA